MESANLSPPPQRGSEGRALISAIIPAPAVAVDTREDAADVVLHPGEREAVALAVASRQQEFATARHCARRALTRLKLAPVPIPPGTRGEPQWPNGVVGSITHCRGYRGAAVARTLDFVTIGIDVEPNEPLPPGVLESVSLPRERTWVEQLLADRPEVRWDRLLFSLKETVYKAWYPLARCWLDFDDALIEVDPAANSFAARLRVAGPELHGRKLAGFNGRWLAADGLLLAAIAVPERVVPQARPHQRAAAGRVPAARPAVRMPQPQHLANPGSPARPGQA